MLFHLRIVCTLQQQIGIVVIVTFCSPKPKVFATWPLAERHVATSALNHSASVSQTSIV